ncbi:MAG TPA: peptidoglycan -binding protein [Stellaceae bacterium]|nr:peptidoglycan -binding protein [Stellaceae bacterium]
MALASRRSRRSSIDIWPGFVDALAQLLMVIIFMLLVFTAGQFYLSAALSGRDEALKQLQAQVSELSDLLSSTQKTNTDLRAASAALTAQLAAIQLERETLTTRVAELAAKADQEKARADEATGKLKDANTVVSADKQKVDAQLRELESLRRDIAALKQVRTQLEGRVAWLAAGQKQVKATEGALRDRSKELEAKLADAKERTLLAQKDIANPDAKLRELTDRAETAEKAAAASRAQVDDLSQQVAALRQQLARIAAALDASEAKVKDQQGQIVELGKRLNLALVSKVEELSKYRSEFFGKVRAIIGNRPDIRVVGDRFVFQSEVLFEPGKADLQEAAKKQLDPIFTALKAIAAKIPPGINWVLRVDGHTDHRKINTPEFPSNWELSTARAISVVRYAIEQGVPADRLAATGFADNQPIDPGTTDEAYRRNRRIELKLTER